MRSLLATVIVLSVSWTTAEACTYPDQFKCTNGECVQKSLRCNFQKECSDGSDELNCSESQDLIPVVSFWCGGYSIFCFCSDERLHAPHVVDLWWWRVREFAVQVRRYDQLHGWVWWDVLRWFVFVFFFFSSVLVLVETFVSVGKASIESKVNQDISFLTASNYPLFVNLFQLLLSLSFFGQRLNRSSFNMRRISHC